MLTKRQKQILDFVSSKTKKKGYAPSLEEIKKHFKLRSVSNIHQHIEAIKKKGYLQKQKNQRRSIELIQSGKMINIPILGLIAAGSPIEAIENDYDYVSVSDVIVKNAKEHYALKVTGDSMIDEGIFEGDIVIIKKLA